MHVFILKSALSLHLFSGLHSVITTLAPLSSNFFLRSVEPDSEAAPVSSDLHPACCCPLSDTIHSPASLSQARSPLTMSPPAQFSPVPPPFFRWTPARSLYCLADKLSTACTSLCVLVSLTHSSDPLWSLHCSGAPEHGAPLLLHPGALCPVSSQQCFSSQSPLSLCSCCSSPSPAVRSQ